MKSEVVDLNKGVRDLRSKIARECEEAGFRISSVSTVLLRLAILRGTQSKSRPSLYSGGPHLYR